LKTHDRAISCVGEAPSEPKYRLVKISDRAAEARVLSKPANLLPWLRSLAAATPEAVLAEAATVQTLWLDPLIRGDLENRHSRLFIGFRYSSTSFYTLLVLIR
jgi:hypothetical protein